MHIPDAAFVPSTLADPVTLGNPQCRPPRNGVQHFRAHRPCFTSKRPHRSSTIRSQPSPSITAATIAVSAEQGTPQSASQALQRQLEASYLARSADELDFRQPQPTTADSEDHAAEDYARLERSWQVQQASTSGRDTSFSSDLPTVPSKSARRRNLRARRRLNRLYTPATHQLSAQPQHPSVQCPDAQYCSSIRQQLEQEKARRRVSR